MKLSLSIGTLGMLLASAGAFLLPSLLQSILFVAGALLMLGTSVLEKQKLFIALQLVVLCGAVAGMMPAAAALRAGAPLFCCFLVILWLYRTGEIKERLELLGVAGVCLLGIGYAVLHPAVYFAGGLLLALYSSLAYRRGVTSAILWAVLNVVFCCAAGWALLR